MTLLAETAPAGSAAPLAALGLGALGLFLLLPKPRHRSLALGTFSALAGLIVGAVWLTNRFGPVAANSLESILFGLFSCGAIIFAAVFVTQRNPARGAIAFAFVIVSVCGLFLLLAAPFLMAATIIIYAGAIIVTFLFVLMLSQTRLRSGENDRTREPLLGTLAGFCFLGFTLFALFLSSPASGADNPLPVQPITIQERKLLLDAAASLETLPDGDKSLLAAINALRESLAPFLPSTNQPQGSISTRLSLIRDPQTSDVRRAAEKFSKKAHQSLTAAEGHLLKMAVTEADVAAAKAQLAGLVPELRLLAARGELPARNVANLGYTLYSEYLLAVELAGAILLAATLGAVLIAGRREAA